jgi:hypothetical protein
MTCRCGRSSTIGEGADVDSDIQPSEETTPVQPPEPPSVQGSCGRCGWHGQVYAGRYGGLRCPVCYALQNGWMPRG